MTLRTRLAVALAAVGAGPVLVGAAYVRGTGLVAMAGTAALLAAATGGWVVRSHQSYVRALTASRDQLRGHLALLGDTLSSTHDLDRILRVILRTAVTATGARSGAVLLLDQERANLVGHVAAERAAPVPATAPVSVPAGAGLLGSVAATGEPRRGRVAAEGVILHESEPRCRTYVVVPISAPDTAMSRAAPWPAPPAVRGVLALYDRLGGDEFDETDLVTLRTFASQAAVAVDNVRIHEEAQRLSLTDPLTGLWNYRYLREALPREVERASRFNHRLAVLALDLDRFKEVNDAYGHPAGDEVLVEFARRVRRETREVDLVFRQGGEEFVVLLPETDTRGAKVLARRLGTAIRREPVIIGPRIDPVGPEPAWGPAHPGKLAIDITVSIGIAVYPEHAVTPQAVLDAADDALYAAKAAGRDTFRVAEAAPPPEVPVAELPVRAGASSPEHDQPRAGSPPRQSTRGRKRRGSGTEPRRGTPDGAPVPRRQRSG